MNINRFKKLIESTLGDVKPLILENQTDSTEVKEQQDKYKVIGKKNTKLNIVFFYIYKNNTPIKTIQGNPGRDIKDAYRNAISRFEDSISGEDYEEVVKNLVPKEETLKEIV